MSAKDTEAELAPARTAYFTAADALIAKLEKRYGTGREGFEHMLLEGFAKMGKPTPESLKS